MTESAAFTTQTILAMLDKECEALRNGAFHQLDEVETFKTKLFDWCQSQECAAGLDWPALQAAFARSERLLRASEAGLRRFQLKLEALKHNHAFLRIYTQRGGRQDLPTFFRGKTDLEA